MLAGMQELSQPREWGREGIVSTQGLVSTHSLHSMEHTSGQNWEPAWLLHGAEYIQEQNWKAEGLQGQGNRSKMKLPLLCDLLTLFGRETMRLWQASFPSPLPSPFIPPPLNRAPVVPCWAQRPQVARPSNRTTWSLQLNTKKAFFRMEGGQGTKDD